MSNSTAVIWCQASPPSCSAALPALILRVTQLLDSHHGESLLWSSPESDPAPTGRLSQCPSSFTSSCSFKTLSSFNRAHGPTALIPSQVMNVPHHTDSKFKHRQMKGGTGRVRTNQEPKAALTWSSGFLIHSSLNVARMTTCTHKVGVQIKCV